jgi:hypothetical protein
MCDVTIMIRYWQLDFHVTLSFDMDDVCMKCKQWKDEILHFSTYYRPLIIYSTSLWQMFYLNKIQSYIMWL